MRIAVIGVALLLGACGDDSLPNVQFEPTLNKVDSPAPAVVDCSGKPDFVPVEADAKITTCTQGDIAATGKTSGTILYTSDSEPGALLARARDHVLKAGLSIRIENETTLSAGEGQRTVMVIVAPQGVGSSVTVNWGRAKQP